MGLQIHRISYALGAEVSGVDLREPLDDRTFDAINRAFLEHQVLVFHDQPLSREQHLAFSRRFGPVDVNPRKAADKRAVEFPEIALIVSRPRPDGEAATGRYNGQEWHIDRSNYPAAAHATIVRVVEIPQVGGDTMFANLYMAYDSLSAGMKEMLEGLYGVHRGGSAIQDYSSPERIAESLRLSPASAHPIVRVHPETGRKALFVCEQVKLFVGMTAEESRPLVRYLSTLAVGPQAVYRHHWRKNDLVMWDNRCCLHIALADYDRRQVRHMERTTVNGDQSGYLYYGPFQ